MFIEPITIGGSTVKKMAEKIKATVDAVTDMTLDGSGEAENYQETDFLLVPEDSEYLSETLAELDSLESSALADAEVIKAEERILGSILNIHV